MARRWQGCKLPLGHRKPYESRGSFGKPIFFFFSCLLRICGEAREKSIKKGKLLQAHKRFCISRWLEPQNNRNFEISAAHFWTTEGTMAVIQHPVLVYLQKDRQHCRKTVHTGTLGQTITSIVKQAGLESIPATISRSHSALALPIRWFVDSAFCECSFNGTVSVSPGKGCACPFSLQ